LSILESRKLLNDTIECILIEYVNDSNDYTMIASVVVVLVLVGVVVLTLIQFNDAVSNQDDAFDHRPR